jgi:hypothetical protein
MPKPGFEAFDSLQAPDDNRNLQSSVFGTVFSWSERRKQLFSSRCSKRFDGLGI